VSKLGYIGIHIEGGNPYNVRLMLDNKDISDQVSAFKVEWEAGTMPMVWIALPCGAVSGMFDAEVTIDYGPQESTNGQSDQG
jgi:carbon starvation protein CstA